MRRPASRKSLRRVRPNSSLFLGEALEPRDLLTQLVLSERQPLDGRWPVDSASASGVISPQADAVLEIPFSARGSERVLFELDTDIPLIDLNVFGPDGTALDAWRLTTASDSSRPNSVWITGVASSVEGENRLTVRLSHEEIGSDRLVVVNAYFGLNLLDVPDAANLDDPVVVQVPTHINGQPVDSSLAWLVTKAEWSTQRYVSTQPWSLSYSRDYGLPTGPSLEVPGQDLVHVRVPPVPDEAIALHDGVWVNYESLTGRVQVRTADEAPMATFQISNQENLFVGPVPPDMGPNGTYAPEKLMKIFASPSRTTSLDFGPILPAGLTRLDLMNKLLVLGTYENGGGFDTVVFSIDGDLPFEMARDLYFQKRIDPELKIYAETRLDLPDADWYQVKLKYQWDPEQRMLTPPSFLPSAKFEYRTGRSDWQMLTNIGTCSVTCELTATIPATGPLLDVRIVAQASDRVLAVQSLDVEAHRSVLPVVFAVDVAADETVTLSSNFDQSYMEVYDDAGQLVGSNEVTIRLGGPGMAAERYFLRLHPRTQIVTLGVSHQPPEFPGSSTPFFRARGSMFEMSMRDSIDVRSCDLTTFTWNGLPIKRYQIDGDVATFELSGPVEPRVYSVVVPDQSCRMTTGEWLQAGSYEVDYEPPKIQSIPLRDRGVLPQGITSFVMNFDEPIANWLFDQPRLLVTGPAGPVNLPFFGINAAQNERDIFLSLGLLDPGHYSVTLEGLQVVDRNHNALDLNGLSFSFVVSDDAALWARAIYDVDLNSIVDANDYQLLRIVSSSFFTPYFDLYRDGVLDEFDFDEWTLRSGAFPTGDIDLNGVFDIWDLYSLSPEMLDTFARRSQGDLNGDEYFTTADLVLAMQGGLKEGLSEGEFMIPA